MALLEAELAKLRIGDTQMAAHPRRRLPPGSPLLHELGRLRRLTFRAIGEGTSSGWI